ncbi:hypothetical protein Tco_0807289 [Tanacetum coccineum]
MSTRSTSDIFKDPKGWQLTKSKRKERFLQNLTYAMNVKRGAESTIVKRSQDGASGASTAAKYHEGYPTLCRKMCCYRPDTSICNLHDRSARRSRAQVKRSRDGASGASTATKCSLAQKRPCGILTGLLTSGGLEFGKCYSLPALSGPWIAEPESELLELHLSAAETSYSFQVNGVVHKAVRL